MLPHANSHHLGWPWDAPTASQCCPDVLSSHGPASRVWQAHGREDSLALSSIIPNLGKPLGAKFGSDHPKLSGQTAAGLLPLLLCRQFPRQETFFSPKWMCQMAPPADPCLPVQEQQQQQLWEFKSVKFWGNK